MSFGLKSENCDVTSVKHSLIMRAIKGTTQRLPAQLHVQDSTKVNIITRLLLWTSIPYRPNLRLLGQSFKTNYTRLHSHYINYASFQKRHQMQKTRSKCSHILSCILHSFFGITRYWDSRGHSAPYRRICNKTPGLDLGNPSRCAPFRYTCNRGLMPRSNRVPNDQFARSDSRKTGWDSWYCIPLQSDLDHHTCNILCRFWCTSHFAHPGRSYQGSHVKCGQSCHIHNRLWFPHHLRGRSGNHVRCGQRHRMNNIWLMQKKGVSYYKEYFKIERYNIITTY